MALPAVRSVIMQSMQRQRPLLHSPSKRLVKSPIKSPTKNLTNGAAIRTPSPSKTPMKSRNVKKSQSDSGLVSSFRKLSVTPNPQTPKRPSSAASRKAYSGTNRGITTFSASTIEDVASLIREKKCRNVIVMAGAGISCPSGIPDFRTPGTGLYDNLQEYNIPEPTAIFDIDYFWYDPRPFFCLAKTLYPGNFQPNLAHYFVRLLHDKGLLLRMYTQNIDGLERLAGLPSEKLVEAHGTFATASCVRCDKSYSGEEIKKTILDGDIPRCREPRCKGIVKPNIVFFGEDLPKRFFYYTKDFPKCDLLFIMGTSLEVQPFAGIVSEVKRATPRVLINKDIVGPFARSWQRRPNDVITRGDVVERLTEFIKLLGWTETMESLIDEANKEWKKTYGEKKSASPAKVSGELTNTQEIKSQPNGKSCVAGEEKESQSSKDGRKGYHTLAGTSTDTTAHSPKNGLLPNKANARSTFSFPGLRNTQTSSTIRTNSTAKTFNDSPTHFKGMFTESHAPLGTDSSGTGSRKCPLLPLRYTHRKEPESAVSIDSYRAIDPYKDLASAGFGRGRRTDLGSVRCFLSHLSDSESDSSSDSNVS